MKNPGKSLILNKDVAVPASWRGVLAEIMIKGVAFDLEGTVVNLEPAHHGAHLRVCRDLGLDFTLEEAIEKIRHFIGGPDRAIAEEIGALAGGKHSAEWIAAQDATYYQEFLATMAIAPRGGFSEVFAWCQERGIKTAVGSLTADREAHHILAASGLSRLFDPRAIVLQSHVKKLKPAPDVFLETARRMGIAPQEQLVFEDSPRGVQAARAAGSRAVGMPVYENPSVIEALLHAGAEKVYAGWFGVRKDIARLVSGE